MNDIRLQNIIIVPYCVKKRKIIFDGKNEIRTTLGNHRLQFRSQLSLPVGGRYEKIYVNVRKKTKVFCRPRT